MGRIVYDAVALLAKTHRQIQMGTRQPCRIAQTEHIHYNRTRQVAGRAIYSSARASGGRVNMSQKGA